MKKSKINNNVQNYDLFDDCMTQKKEDKNNSLISLHDSINNPLLSKSNNPFANMPSKISYKGQIFPTNYPITPHKRNNNLLSSSNKNKNLSSSGSIWKRIKVFNNNGNTNNNIDDNCAKRKLFVSNITSKSNLNQNQNFHFALETLLNNNENNINNNIPLFTPPKKDKEKEEDIKEKEKVIEEDKKENGVNSNKVATSNKLFFTEYGLGYKCNCTKTGCNKYYCQCYNQGRYCHGCNCQNCQNKMPDFISSNKRPKKEEDKQKVIIVSCTCTKSGCNKNYCECYKNKTKCNSQCRCRNCENIESEKTELIFDNNQKLKYECSEENSIFIIKNKITVEDLPKKNRKIKIIMNDISSLSSYSENNIIIGKKTKRKDNNENHFLSNKKSKISEEFTDESMKGKKNEFDENDLFDKEGKLILTHIKI